MKTYYKRKTIPCKQCGKRFKEAWQVAQHVKFEHPKATQGIPGIGKSEYLDQDAGMIPQTKPVFTLNYCPNCGHKLV